MASQSAPTHKARTDLLIDAAIFLAFLIALDPHWTGIAIHEWLSIAGTAVVIVHLLLHWDWIVEVTGRFFSKLNGNTRLNWIINAVFFVDFVVIMLSGFFISESALPLLGIATDHHNRFWGQMHDLSANLSLLILGLHVAIHWKWIVSTIKRYILRPVAGLFGRPVAAQPAVESEGASR